jgi:flagellar hook-length control protein FliK
MITGTTQPAAPAAFVPGAATAPATSGAASSTSAKDSGSTFDAALSALTGGTPVGQATAKPAAGRANATPANGAAQDAAATDWWRLGQADLLAMLAGNPATGSPETVGKKAAADENVDAQAEQSSPADADDVTVPVDVLALIAAPPTPPVQTTQQQSAGSTSGQPAQEGANAPLVPVPTVASAPTDKAKKADASDDEKLADAADDALAAAAHVAQPKPPGPHAKSQPAAGDAKAAAPVPVAPPAESTAQVAANATTPTASANEQPARASHDATTKGQTIAFDRVKPAAAEQPAQVEQSSAAVDAPTAAVAGNQHAFGNGAGEHGEHGSSGEQSHDAKASLTAGMPAAGAMLQSDFAAKLAPVVTAEVASTTPPSSHDSENINRLVHTMRVQVRDNVSEATISLRPEHLGEVKISIKVEGNSVTAVVHAESAGVREWLQTHEAALRSGLAEQGLQLDRLVVDAEKPAEERGDSPRQQQQQQPQEERQSRFRRQRGRQDDVRFEVSA